MLNYPADRMRSLGVLGYAWLAGVLWQIQDIPEGQCLFAGLETSWRTPKEVAIVADHLVGVSTLSILSSVIHIPD